MMKLGEDITRPVFRGRASVQLKHRLCLMGTHLGVSMRTVPKSQREVDLIHGLRVLAHAEIQEFLESLASKIIDITWDHGRLGRVTHAGHHLMVHHMSVMHAQKRDTQQARYPLYDKHQALAQFLADSSVLDRALNKHKEVIKRNNGIKEGNARSLLLPLGYRENFFVPGLLSELSSLGTARGHVAHGTGVIIGANNWPSGSTEWTRINRIQSGLEMLERFAPRLLAPI